MVTGLLPESHPDRDVLADLAAEALPAVEARAVEAHVIGCHRCADVLADAEQVRVLLRGADPGPMPQGVLSRLELVLSLEAAARHEVADQPLLRPAGRQSQPADGFADQPPGPAGPARARPAPGRRAAATPDRLEPGESSRGRRASMDDTVWETEAMDVVNQQRGPGMTPQARTVRRTAGGPTPSRRERRVADRRAARLSGSLARLGGPKVLAAAAGVILVLAAAGYSVPGLVGHGGSGNESSSVADAAPRAVSGGIVGADQSAASIPVLHTGTAYTTAAFIRQVRDLLAHRAAPAPAAPSSQANRAGAAGEALASAEGLQACVNQLGGGGSTPVAVDFGTYDGRPAAIIVLPAPGGGYQAWAVQRDCRPGQEGALRSALITD